MNILDLIFPKKCINCRRFGDFLCADCFASISFNQKFTCPTCLKLSFDGMTHPGCIKTRQIDGIMPVVSYGKVVKKLIYQYKYKPHISKLASVISELMTEGLSQNEGFYRFVEQSQPVIVPIPLSSRRLRERGYNHAELLASYVAQYFKLVISNKLLVRSKDTKPMYKLNREERIKNIENAFQVRPNPKIPNIPNAIILIDDIATSYSTLKEAARVLKMNGSKKVLGLTFAKEA